MVTIDAPVVILGLAILLWISLSLSRIAIASEKHLLWLNDTSNEYTEEELEHEYHVCNCENCERARSEEGMTDEEREQARSEALQNAGHCPHGFQERSLCAICCESLN